MPSSFLIAVVSRRYRKRERKQQLSLKKIFTPLIIFDHEKRDERRTLFQCVFFYVVYLFLLFIFQ